MNENSIINRNGFFEYPFPAIFPGTPISSFQDLINEIESVFSNSCVKKSFPYPIDIIVKYNKKTDIPEQYLINVALAGFSKEEVKVKLIQNKALKVDLIPLNDVDYSDEKYEYYAKYLSHGIAKRAASYTWSLTPRIDAKNMLVQFIDGVLSIALPIISEQKDNEQNEIEININ